MFNVSLCHHPFPSAHSPSPAYRHRPRMHSEDFILFFHSTLSISHLFPLLVFFFFFHCWISPWLSLLFLKAHLYLFKGRWAPLGPSRHIVQVVQIPVSERTGKVSLFPPKSQGVNKFDTNIISVSFMSFISHVLSYVFFLPAKNTFS